LRLELKQETDESVPITIRPVSPSELEELLLPLGGLLRDAVNGGSPMGFLAPLTDAGSRDYWLSLLPELRSGSRLLLAARDEDAIVGTGQLSLSSLPNGRHRAELQKLFVSNSLRGRGVGRSLLAALHDAARERGRTLLVLNTRHGGVAERFYKSLGYSEAGVIPGWSAGPAGERYDHVTLYQELSL
jgi:acetyltransferase